MSYYYQPMYNPPVPDHLTQMRQQQYPPQQYQQPQYQQSQNQGNSGIIWVQGEAGAKAYIVGPGNSVLLMDSENPCFYIKSVGQNGMPSMQVFDYTERVTTRHTPQPANLPVGDFITRQEFDAFVQQLTSKLTPKEEIVNE